MTTETPHAARPMLIEAALAVILLVLAFLAIAATDVSTTGSESYWLGLVGLYAVVAFVFDRLHTGRPWTDWRSILAVAIHWIGVLAAIYLVHVFVNAGRINNANIGLANGLLLALGAFTAGAAGNWRMLVIGVALGIATAVVAVVEQFLWVLLAVAILAILAMVLLERLRRGRGAAPGA